MKNVPRTMAKTVLIPTGSTAAESAADAQIKKSQGQGLMVQEQQHQ